MTTFFVDLSSVTAELKSLHSPVSASPSALSSSSISVHATPNAWSSNWSENWDDHDQSEDHSDEQHEQKDQVISGTTAESLYGCQYFMSVDEHVLLIYRSSSCHVLMKTFSDKYLRATTIDYHKLDKEPFSSSTAQQQQQHYLNRQATLLSSYMQSSTPVMAVPEKGSATISSAFAGSFGVSEKQYFICLGDEQGQFSIYDSNGSMLYSAHSHSSKIQKIIGRYDHDVLVELCIVHEDLNMMLIHGQSLLELLVTPRLSPMALPLPLISHANFSFEKLFSSEKEEEKKGPFLMFNKAFIPSHHSCNDLIYYQSRFREYHQHGQEGKPQTFLMVAFASKSNLLDIYSMPIVSSREPPSLGPPVLTGITNVATKMGSAVSNWLFASEKEAVKISTPSPVHSPPSPMLSTTSHFDYYFSFPKDGSRVLTSLTLCPFSPKHSLFLASTDSLGRVMLFDLHSKLLLYIWKGYRFASCAFLLATKRICLVIYSQKRSTVEIWHVSPPMPISLIRIIQVSRDHQIYIKKADNSACYLLNTESGALEKIQI